MQGYFKTVENGIHYRYVHLESGMWQKICADSIKKHHENQKSEIHTLTYFDSLLKEEVQNNNNLNQKASKSNKNVQKSNKKKKKSAKKKEKQLTKGQIWWRSLTLEEQAKWRYNLMLKKKGKADYQFELEQCRKDNLYKH